MSMMTTAYLLETYGARLTVEELAEVLRLGVPTVRNRLSAGTLGVRTYTDGDRRFADALDVACYPIDSVQGSARIPACLPPSSSS